VIVGLCEGGSELPSSPISAEFLDYQSNCEHFEKPVHGVVKIYNAIKCDVSRSLMPRKGFHI
jgi:hypothetical protein